jgi:general secretion pathway protein A
VFKSIQERISSLAKDKRIIPVLIIDEAQYLKTDVINSIKMILNFEMDSKNHAIFILNGQPSLNITLSKQVHESIRQRIVIKYNFEGISKSEMEDYISSRLELCGVHEPVFNKNSMEAIYSCCNGSTRKVNAIVEKCLIIGAQTKNRVIDTEMVMTAQNEIELIS